MPAPATDRPHRQLTLLLCAGAVASALVLAAAWQQWRQAKALQHRQELRLAGQQLAALADSVPGWPADRRLRQRLDELLADPQQAYAELAVSNAANALLLRRGRYDDLDLPLPAVLRDGLRALFYRWRSYPGALALRDASGAVQGQVRFRLLNGRQLSRDAELSALRTGATLQAGMGLLLLGGFLAVLRRRLQPPPDWSQRLVWNKAAVLRPGTRVADIESHYADITRQRIGRALDGLHYAVILVARDGRIRYVNETAEQLTGWTTADAQGRLVYSVFHTLGEDGIPEITPVENCLREGEDMPSQPRSLRARGGETRPVEVMACLLRDHEGVVDGAAMLFRDTSDSTRQFEELRRQARLSQAVVDHLDEGLLTTDPAGVVRFANARAQRMFGYSREEMAGVTVTKLMPVPFLNTPGVRIGDYIGARTGGHLPKVVGWRKDATTFPAELWVQPMSVDDSSGLVVIVRDISERLRGENLASRLGRLLDSAMEEIYIFDAQTLYFLEVNRGAQRNLGYAPEQLTSMTPLQISEELDAATFQSYLARLRGGDTGHLSYRCRHRRVDGSTYPVEVRLNFSREEEPPVFMAIVADITDRQAAEERLHQLAHFDALTGLPNRTVLNDRLHQALLAAGRSARMLGVFFIDLDHFKPINDKHGHEIGDRVLKATAERLRRCLRSADTVARLGGDEFVIVAQGLRTREDAERLAQKILDGFIEPLQVNGLTLNVTPSIGIALYPLVETDAEGLLRYADSAMYQAKQSGRARYQIFEADLAPERRRRLELQREVRTAVALNQFRPALQPVVEARSGAVAAALLRFEWHHARHGLVHEEEAIRAAHRAGVLGDLELWCIYQACEIHAEGRRRGAVMPPMLVEVSGWQLRAPDFALYVVDLLERFRLPPAQLVLVLKAVSPGEPFLQHEAVRVLLERGVRFALHLEAVATLIPAGVPPLRLLLGSAALLQGGGATLQALAQQQHAALLARDVDDAAQPAQLEAVGCAYLCGEGLLPPQPLAEFVSLLGRSSLKPL